MSAAKFQVGDKVISSLKCPKKLVFKGVDKIDNVEYDPYNSCSWYDLKSIYISI